MSIIKKMVLCIKNIFIKQDKIKKLPEPKVITQREKKENFIETLKIIPIEKIIDKKIETLICKGDGLGIQKKITY